MTAVAARAVTASRTDPATGVLEEASFFGAGSERMFGYRYTPASPPAGGVVICPSIHAEVLSNYRQEVLLARSLAARGIIVQRFYYRGTGHSFGDVADLTFERMTGDAREALAQVRAEAGTVPVGVLGTRFGGLVAAAVASTDKGSPLALWEPVTNPSHYWREVFRVRSIQELNVQKPAPSDRLSPVDEIAARGVVDIVGYPIHRPLYDGTVTRTLQAELGAWLGPLLLVQLSKRKGLKPGHERLVADLRNRGVMPDVVLIPEEPAWWLLGSRILAERLIESTTQWFLRTLARGTP